LRDFLICEGRVWKFSLTLIDSNTRLTRNC